MRVTCSLHYGSAGQGTRHRNDFKILIDGIGKLCVRSFHVSVTLWIDSYAFRPSSKCRNVKNGNCTNSKMLLSEIRRVFQRFKTRACRIAIHERQLPSHCTQRSPRVVRFREGQDKYWIGKLSHDCSRDGSIVASNRVFTLSERFSWRRRRDALNATGHYAHRQVIASDLSGFERLHCIFCVGNSRVRFRRVFLAVFVLFELIGLFLF